MTLQNILKLVLLAALWGSSFVFMRIISPTLGTIVTAGFRMLIGGGVIVAYLLVRSARLNLRRDLPHYFWMGVLNGVIPFSLYAYSALIIPASYSAVINTTTPMFGAVLAALVLKEKLTPRKALGILVGVGGVTLVAQVGSQSVQGEFLWGVFASLGAAFCYAVAGIYMKKYGSRTDPIAIAGCGQFLAGLLMLPLIPFFPPKAELTATVVFNLLGLSLLGGTLAFIVFYKLLAEIGPSKTLSVAFIIPVFGMIWSALFLGEHITPTMVLGAVIVILGTYFVVSGRKSKTRII